MVVQVTRAVLAQLSAEAKRAAPEECCGILLGEENTITTVVPAANVHQAPLTRFEIDPKVLIDAHRQARAGGLPVLGYYHSHPDGPAHPSGTDQRLAAGDNTIWAIIALGETTWWHDTVDGFRPLSLALTEG